MTFTLLFYGVLFFLCVYIELLIVFRDRGRKICIVIILTGTMKVCMVSLRKEWAEPLCPHALPRGLAAYLLICVVCPIYHTCLYSLLACWWWHLSMFPLLWTIWPDEDPFFFYCLVCISIHASWLATPPVYLFFVFSAYFNMHQNTEANS